MVYTGRILRNKKTAKIKESSGAGVFFTCAVTVAVIMAAVFVKLRIRPFGPNAFLRGDALHQYLSYFTALQRKLKGDGSLLYDFSGGLGFNFLPVYAYYLASPVNFLIAIFPEGNAADFIGYLIFIKVCVSGGIFSVYLFGKRGGDALLPVIFGVMYATGNFLVGYGGNVMWLDTVAVAPIVMYGLERLFKGRGGSVYGLSLFFGIWCNFYIGFMLCLFSCLYFLILLFSQKGKMAGGGVKKVVHAFAVYSVGAGCAAAIIWLPAYAGSRGSFSLVWRHMPKPEFYAGLLKLAAGHLVTSRPICTNTDHGLINAYCGSSVPVLCLLFAADRRLPVKERAAGVILPFILLLSAAFAPLGFVWHGFCEEHGVPNRFAFLYVIMILTVAYIYLPRVAGYDKRRFFAVGAASLILTAAACVFASDGDLWVQGPFRCLLPVSLTLINLALLYVIAVSRGRHGPAFKVFCVLLIAEAVAHGVPALTDLGAARMAETDKRKASFKSLSGALADDASFARSEEFIPYFENTVMYYGGASATLFCSTMPMPVTFLAKRLGVYGNVNLVAHNGTFLPACAILGVRYVFGEAAGKDSVCGMKWIGGDDTFTVYDAGEGVSAGYVVREGILETATEYEEDPLLFLNDFYETAIGERNVFKKEREVSVSDGETLTLTTGAGERTFLYLQAQDTEVSVSTPEYDCVRSLDTGRVYDMGPEGVSKITVKPEDPNETVKACVYTCAEADFKRVTDILEKERLENVKVTGGTFSGSFYTEDGGALIVSVPYEDGWRCFLDGEEVKPSPAMYALTGFEVSAGAHDLYMEYFPPGLKAGAAVSAAGVLILAAAIVSDRRKKKGNVK